MDDVAFLGDQIPIEVLRFLPIAQLVAPQTAAKVAQFAVLFLTSTPKAIEAASTAAPTQLNTDLETELQKSVEALQDKKSKRKLTKYEMEHIQYAQQTGLFPVVFTGMYTWSLKRAT